jgi:hypothetical protein
MAVVRDEAVADCLADEEVHPALAAAPDVGSAVVDPGWVGGSKPWTPGFHDDMPGYAPRAFFREEPEARWYSD